MKILYAGDVFGSPGRKVFVEHATAMKASGEVDVIVVNGENAAGGRGLNAKQAKELFEAGADLITLGDHAWDQREMLELIERDSRIIRPANFPTSTPGKGIHTFSTPSGDVTAIIVIGRVFMNFPYDDPFVAIDALLKKHRDSLAPTILVEIHCEATSEKQAIGRHLDGRVTAVVGSHTHVQTSDETILPRGTAYITDLGMTGPHDSIIGSTVGPVLKRFKTGIHQKFQVASERVRLEGVLIETDLNGKAKSIERVRLSSTATA